MHPAQHQVDHWGGVEGEHLGDDEAVDDGDAEAAQLRAGAFGDGESLAHPLTIISTLPAAGLGALLALVVTRSELTPFAFIGIILLIGIVKKNRIMLVDFALDAKRDLGRQP